MSRVFISGSSDGLGLMAARLLVDGGHEVMLHARNTARAEDARRSVPQAKAVTVGDLSSIEETRRVAEQVNALGRHDAVIHNAGVGYREARRIETVDGLSHVFAVNVLAPYLLTALITPPDRLVYLSSGMHVGGDPHLRDPQWAARRWNGAQAYSDSKLLDVVLAFAVARLWRSVLSNALEPGWVPTKMGGPGAPDDLSLAPVTQVWLAVSDRAADASDLSVAWWKEPNRDQWLAWWAAWLGWTLDAFDFTMFLLIMVPISQEFHVPLTDVAFVLSVTLWLRLLGAVGSGWLADRVGRKIPLMISILWYSLSNFAAGFSPTFTYLFLFRALLGIGMGGEWPAGAALAMETWPVRSRGFMGGVLQGSWGLGFMLSSAIYGLFYAYIGWRGMLWIGVLPALSVFYVRKFVKEPPIWLENRRRQRVEQREVHAPLISIFKPRVLGNTLTACLWLAGGFVAYYSVNALFATHLQKDLHLAPALVATPIFFANLGVFLAASGWGWWSDRWGRRWAIIIPALIALPLAPLYLLSSNFLWIAVGFVAQGFCAGGGMHGQMVPYLNERFPTEIRATASAFCYHQAAIFGGFVPLILTFFAEHFGTGLAEPMIIGTWIGCVAWAAAAFYGPETKDKVLVPDLVVA